MSKTADFLNAGLEARKKAKQTGAAIQPRTSLLEQHRAVSRPLGEYVAGAPDSLPAPNEVG